MSNELKALFLVLD